MTRLRAHPASTRWIAGLAGAVGLAALLLPRAAFTADKTPQAPQSQMSDADWKKNSSAGAVPERYQIVKGDTLWGISKRFFGDGMAWPKLYESNKDTISDPNLIYPDKWVVFVPGTGVSAPKLADQGTAPPTESSGPDAGATASAPEADKSVAKKTVASDKITTALAKERSQEWKLLPKQSWETAQNSLPPNTDHNGFENGNKIQFSKPKGFNLEAIAATDRITTLGQIVGGRSGANYLSLGDTVYIRADEDIQLGETYAITQEPNVLKSRKSDRQGYSYLILGKVKIIGVRDDLFVGTIVAGQDLIYRGNDIIPAPPKVPVMDPVAAGTAIEGVMMLDKHFSTFFTAQHKLVFIDRGSADGVKIGNIFRAYEHYDLANEKKITSSDFIIDADAMVVQVSERFCVATIINSLVPVTENSTAVLLTDVSDLDNKKGFSGPETGSGSKEGTDELDELDKLDNGGGMGKDEQKELQQLEKWKGNPQGQPTPGAAPGAPPASNEEVAPPPPPPPPGEPKAEEVAPPPPAAPESPPPPPPSPSDEAAPPPPPPEGEPPAPAAPAKKNAPSAGSPAPAAPAPPPPPPPPPPPAPGEGASQPPTDESKALDKLLNE